MITQFAILAQIVAFSGIEGHQVGDPAVQRMRTICGPNALYSLLKCCDLPADYAEIERNLPMESRGVSLLSLKRAAQHFGLQTRVRKYSSESILGLQTPAIAHHYFDMKTNDSDAHYVLLTSITDDDIEFIDGTTGLLQKVSAAKFYSTWSGYVLEPAGNASASASLMISLGVAAGILCFPKFLRVAAGCGRRAMPPAISGSLLVFTLLPAAHAGNDPSGLGSDEYWRMSTSDSINCIDLYAKSTSHFMERHRIKSELGEKSEKSSLLDLKRASRALGLTLRIIKPTPSDLAATPLPAIVHMVDEGGEHGGYFLLINPKKSKFETINCTSLTIESMSAEEFRRRWSGYALVAEDKQVSWLRGALLGLGTFGVGSWMYRKFTANSKRSRAARRIPI